LNLEEKWNAPGAVEAETRNLEWYIKWLDHLGDQRAHTVGNALKMMGAAGERSRELIWKLIQFGKSELNYLKKVSQTTLDFISRFPIMTKTYCTDKLSSSKMVQIGLNGALAKMVTFDSTIRSGARNAINFCGIFKTQDWLGLYVTRFSAQVNPQKKVVFGIPGVEEPDISGAQISIDLECFGGTTDDQRNLTIYVEKWTVNYKLYEKVYLIVLPDVASGRSLCL
jgi:hypothetical protein